MSTTMSLYYALYPYRGAAPTERLSIIRAEIISPISHIWGIAKLLTLQAASAAALPLMVIPDPFAQAIPV
jgi:hypothetical protein